MKASELLAASRLTDAIESLGVELRSDPTDAQRRSLLFELLAFALLLGAATWIWLPESRGWVVQVQH